MQVRDAAGNLSAWATVFTYRYYASHVTKYYSLGPVTAMRQDGSYYTLP